MKYVGGYYHRNNQNSYYTIVSLFARIIGVCAQFPTVQKKLSFWTNVESPRILHLSLLESFFGNLISRNLLYQLAASNLRKPKVEVEPIEPSSRNLQPSFRRVLQV